MITDPQGSVLALFVVFCRIGACMMVLPGFSSARIPMILRLLMSAAISLALLPLLWDVVYPRVGDSQYGYIRLVAGEFVIGVMYGLIARFFVLGLQFTGTVLSMSIGFSAPGAPDILEDTAENQLTNLISFGGLMLLFAMDFHHVVFKALADSYTLTPLGGYPSAQKMLITLTDTLGRTFVLMLRLASPFLIFGIMFNFSIGMINKLAPQIPIFFISTPYLLFGGLFLLYLSIAAMVQQFAEFFPGIFLG